MGSFSRHSNNAGLPLPFIPRRRSSVPNSQAIFPFPPPDPVVRPPSKESPNLSSPDSGEADGGPKSPGSPRSAKVWTRCGIQPLLPLQPVEPSYVSTLEFPRQSPMLAASVSTQSLPPSQSVPALALDEPDPTADSAVILTPSPSVDGNIRKKSGEPLRSSLKSRPPTPRPSLAVVTGQPSSKSEPATPNHVRSKSVSFAERLDHVKLFFAEQKPIAVSRNGSPTEDTSGTESEAPVPVREPPPDDEKKRLLVMEVVNFPQRWTMDVDVMLEDITLSREATICGHVKVRNIAFEKSVAVRFTFDFWQTTSEVSAKYEQSLAHGAFDRFSFVVRLHDILSKIEDKTLFMAVRYTVNGQELWDNNWGKNYKIKFSLPIPSRPQGKIAQIQYASDEEAVADLTQKLERVQSTEALKGAQRFHHRRRSGSADDTFFFNSATSLSSRYAWESSLKKTWKPTDHSTPSHLRMTSLPTSNSVFPWTQKPNPPSPINQKHRAIQSQTTDITRGSPRLGDDAVPPEIATRNPPTGNLLHEDGSAWRGGFRNHRRGSFDARPPSGLANTDSPDRKTKAVFDVGPPRDNVGESGDVVDNEMNSPIPQAVHVHVPVLHMASGVDRTSSGGSSITSSASSSSQPSPVVITPPPPSQTMASIINRFCFYTSSGTETGTTIGPQDDGGVLGLGVSDCARDDGMDLALAADADALGVPEEALQRSRSTSSIEDILRHAQRATSPERMESPYKPRSSSYDDLVSLSGSPTPTLTPTNPHFRL